MTEQEFQTQVWRPYDKITTADGVPGKVLGVSFMTKSVRAFISALIDSLREKVLRADKRINDLELEREKLIEKVSKNHLADIMTALNMLKEGLTVKKKKLEKVENAVGMIEQTLSKIEVNP